MSETGIEPSCVGIGHYILVKFVFTEILVKFMKSIFGSEILVELIFGQEMIIFGSFNPK